MIGEEPQYSRLAARLLAGYIEKEVRNQGVASFSQSIALGHAEGLIGDETAAFVKDNARKLDFAIDVDADHRFEYFGLRTILTTATCCGTLSLDVCWSIHSTSSCVSPVACPPRSLRPVRAVRAHVVAGLPAVSPTLFNAGARHTQMSSCYLVDSPRTTSTRSTSATPRSPSCRSSPAASASPCSRVRSRGALIRGTNGQSNGIVPFLRTLDASVAAVNQGGRRKGAACVYLEPWHADVEEFLELRDNTGEDARRTHNLNLANWIPDEFMRRVEGDADWSLFDPNGARTA